MRSVSTYSSIICPGSRPLEWAGHVIKGTGSKTIAGMFPAAKWTQWSPQTELSEKEKKSLNTFPKKLASRLSMNELNDKEVLLPIPARILESFKKSMCPNFKEVPIRNQKFAK